MKSNCIKYGKKYTKILGGSLSIQAIYSTAPTEQIRQNKESKTSQVVGAYNYLVMPKKIKY